MLAVLRKQKQQLEAQMKALKEPLKKALLDDFKDRSKQLFVDNPLLEQFSWRQYTPSFNDGDPCYFRCYAEWPAINGLDEDEYYEDEQLRGIAETLNKFLGGYNESEFELMFGDPAEVIVTATDITLEECYHD